MLVIISVCPFNAVVLLALTLYPSETLLQQEKLIASFCLASKHTPFLFVEYFLNRIQLVTIGKGNHRTSSATNGLIILRLNLHRLLEAEKGIFVTAKIL